MKQKSLKHRKILQLLQSKPISTTIFFIPSDELEEKSLKNRVQVLPKRGAWNRLENTPDKEP